MRRGQVSEELGPYLDEDEVEAIDRLGQRLLRERPTPTLGFRVELRTRLVPPKDAPRSAPPARRRVAPPRPALTIGVYVGTGLAALGVAALGVAGAGPLAP